VSNQTVARNYAEVLFDIAGRSGQPERYADLIDAVAAAVDPASPGGADVSAYSEE
jgi:F0F1-type ATP synthase delta subunit